jgi:two-component sensor histidine kinase
MRSRERNAACRQTFGQADEDCQFAERPSERQKVPARLRAAPADAPRLDVLENLGLLDMPPEEALDRVTRLATLIFDAPVALITVVDESRQFFLSQHGLAEPWSVSRETPLSHSFCRYVVIHRQPLVIEDARKASLTAGNPAIQELGVIAYLGVPLRRADGHVVGALCLIDHDPRRWEAKEVEILSDLAHIAMDEILLRQSIDRQREADTAIREAEERFRALAADLSHRVNNAVAIIGSVVRHSLRMAESLPQAARALEGRLQALVGAHDLMNRDAWVQTRLVGVIKGVLTQFGRNGKAISLKGDDVALPSRLALLFALTVHELTSNAVRHGSLLSPVGRVFVRWKLLEDGKGARRIVFLWLEEGGPSVRRPRRLGFGTFLIRRLAQAQNVAVRIDYRPVGLRFLLQAPLAERAPPANRQSGS